MGRVQSRMRHKSGDLSYLSCFNFFGDWEDETMATEDKIDMMLFVSFADIVSSAQGPMSGFFIFRRDIYDSSRFPIRLSIRIKGD